MRSDFGARGTGFGVLRNHSLCGRSGRWSPAQGMRVSTHLDRSGADAIDSGLFHTYDLANSVRGTLWPLPVNESLCF